MTKNDNIYCNFHIIDVLKKALEFCGVPRYREMQFKKHWSIGYTNQVIVLILYYPFQTQIIVFGIPSTERVTLVGEPVVGITGSAW